MFKPLDIQKSFVALQSSRKNVEPDFLAVETLDGSLGKDFLKVFFFFTYNMLLIHLVLMSTFPSYRSHSIHYVCESIN